MPVDPDVQARVVRLSGVDPATLPPAAERIASTALAFAALGIDSPAVRAAPAAIWATDTDGLVLSWNDMAGRMFGWAADEVIGRPVPFALRDIDATAEHGRPGAGPAADERPVRPRLAVVDGGAPANGSPVAEADPSRPVTRSTTASPGVETTAGDGASRAPAPIPITGAAGDAMPDADARPGPPAELVTHARDGHELHVLVSSSVRHDPDDPPVTVWFATDVTDERAAAGKLEVEHDRWRRLLAGIADTVIILDERCLVREVTAYTPVVLGHRAEDLVGSSGFAQLDPADHERAGRAWERLLADPGGEAHDTFRIRHADGHYEQVELTATNLVADPVIRGIVMTGRLVTTQKESEALIASETEVLDLIARGAPLPATLSAITRIVESHTGGSAGILLLRPDAREFDIGTAGSVPMALLELLRRAPLTPSLTFETIDFRRVTVIGDLGSDRRTGHFAQTAETLGARSAWSIPVIKNRSGELLGLIAIFHSHHRPPSTYERRVGETASHLAAIAIERHRWQDQLRHQARHDELTGLPNRRSILGRLDRALAEGPDGTGPDRRTVAVVFVDIDRFKAVNDSYGHAAGDRLLVRFAVRLRNLVGSDDFVGHFGADEFVIILGRAAGVDDTRLVASRIDLALSEPFSLDEGEVYLTASIGVALCTGSETGVELIQHADAAMARAKDLGRDRMEVFDQVMRIQADAQLRIDRQLRAAVDRGELTIHYQPTVDVHSGATVGAEALLRWNHPTEGLLLPDTFLTVAEDTGTIVRIGRWVLDQAVAQARAWLDRHPHLEPFAISVNVSPRQLASPGFVEHVERTLDRHCWPADELVLELTEGILIEDRDASLALLNDLKSLGVRLAIDDFGTGFSSLNELHRFPLDTVKIDPSFVDSLEADGAGSPVVTAVLHMAHALGLRVVAEGVERADQHAGLQKLLCDQAQGFLFAVPAPPDELEERWLSARSPGPTFDDLP
jgi:diguanylate cyclase (GGDEF)-like protein/PAS domain S-box-containing protein